jgi:transcriptional regulator
MGVGSVVDPLPSETRAGSGEAFVLAREAVESAKKNTANLCLRAQGDQAIAERLDASLQLVALLERRRSAPSAEAGALLAKGFTQREVGESLGISQQAVSSRLASGLWNEVERMKAWIVADLEELVR